MLIQVDVSEYEMAFIRGEIVPWVKETFGDEFVYAWPNKYFIFHDDEGATAFMLKFGGKRTETKIEKMIKAFEQSRENEKSNN